MGGITRVQVVDCGNERIEADSIGIEQKVVVARGLTRHQSAVTDKVQQWAGSYIHWCILRNIALRPKGKILRQCFL